MHHDFFGLIRAVAFVGIILLVIGLSVSETQPADLPSDEATDPAPTKVLLTCLDDDPMPTINRTIPEEPPIETTEPPETEPVETWQSLGTYTLTAYCPCEQCCGIYGANRPTDENGNPIVYTSIGAVAKAGTTIAVDPSVIPYGSSVEINGHVYIAQDTGGAMNGNRIDIYFDDHQEALNFGRQTAEVFLKTEPR